MSKGTHNVVLYVHKKSKRFSITARMERARLPDVNDQMAQQGYTPIVLAEDLEKLKANKLKHRICAACEIMGYTKQGREPLS